MLKTARTSSLRTYILELKFHTNHYNFKEQLYVSALKEAMNKLKNMEKKEAS